MKLEIKPRDKRLLQVAVSLLIVVLMFRFAILPMLDAHKAASMEYEEKSIQKSEMQMLLDGRDANERRIGEGNKTLDELTQFCYEIMENRQIDELVTGLALDHQLFPSRLSISEWQEGIPASYLYSPEGASELLMQAQEESREESAGTEIDGESAAPAPASVIKRASASLSVSGSDGNMKAFLNDIEEHYPAVHIKSFSMTEDWYMNEALEPVTETQMNVVLEIYMYSRPGEQ